MLIAPGRGGDPLLGHQIHRVLQCIYKEPHIPHHGDRAAAGAGPVGGGQHLVHKAVRLAHAHLVPRHLFQRGGAASLGQAQGGAGIEIGKKYVMTDADVNGYNMSAAQLGGYAYSVLLNADGTVAFVMAGANIPGLTWAYGKVPTDAGEADGVVMDYYTQALNLVPTAQGFDMDYFGSMMMHFAPEGI